MINEQNHKRYDLEERTLYFAKKVKDLIKKTPRTVTNLPYMNQIIRSSSSIGANYIEANEALSKKDFFMRIKISRKEAKESEYWLKLLDTSEESQKEKEELLREAVELRKIFGAIVSKSAINTKS